MPKVYSPAFKSHPLQEKVLADKSRYQIIVAGRRFGKGNLALRKAATIAYQKPGCRIWLVSPNYSFTDPMWDKALSAFYPIRIDGRKFVKGVRLKDRKVFFSNGSALQFKSGDEPNTLRGAGDLMEFLIFDEAAYCKRDVWKAVRPALMDRQAPAMFITTPHSAQPKNWIYDLFLKGQDHLRQTCNSCLGSGCEKCNDLGYKLVKNESKHPSYRSWQFSSYDNPFIADQEIDDMINEADWNPLDIQREVYGEFVGGEAIVFTLEGIRDCAEGHEEGYDPECEYVMGVDLGKVQSYTVVTILRVPKTETELPRIVKFRRFQGGWPVQKQKIVALAQGYGIPIVMLDASGVGDPMRDELREAGLKRIKPVKFSGINKPQMVESLIAAVESKSLTWPSNKQIEKEMLNMEANVLPSGAIQYRHAKGHHDDCVLSMCLCWYGYQKYAGPRRPKVWIHTLG